MKNPFKKMRGDRKGWYKVSDLVAGLEIAVPRDVSQTQRQSRHGDVQWDEIVSITPVGRERVYDIEVEGTHNFVGNGIFAHNTYVLRANTMLAVEGEVHADSFAVPIESATGAASTSALGREIPSEVLTADGLGVDLYKLSTYNLSVSQALAARMDAEDVRVTSLETRVEALESGAVSSTSGNLGIGTTTLASAFESFGAFIKSGLAQFGSLVADRFVAATNSAGTSSAGTVAILAGNTVAQVNNAYVTPATKVFVTFNSPITGTWYVSEKKVGSFRVVLSEVPAADVSFDYFLVQTEGQATATVATSTDTGPSVEYIGPPYVTSSVVTSPSSTPPSTDTSTSTQPTSGDTTAPVVTLNGDAALQLTVGDAFTDPGATAADDVDGDLTAGIVVTGAVDTATEGLYTLTYTATDTAGNIGSASRVVSVAAPSAPAPEPAPTLEPTPEPSPTDTPPADTTTTPEPPPADTTTPTDTTTPSP